MKNVIKEKDELISKLTNGVQDQDNRANTLRDLLREKDLQVEAMFAKIEELRSQHEEVSFKFIEQQREMTLMSSSEFAKQNLLLKKQNEELTAELKLRTEYADNLKQNMKLALENITSAHDNQQ